MADEAKDSVLQPFFAAVRAKTFADPALAGYVEFVENFAAGWAGDFLHPLGDNLHRAGVLKNNALFCFLSSQTNVLEWLSMSLLCGLYEVVMRELRTILEGMFPAFRLDVTNQGMSLEAKLNRLRELIESRHTYGKTAFKTSGVPEWSRYYDLYRALCSYTHLSMTVAGANMRKVATQGYGEIPEFGFDRVLFVESVQMWDRVAQLALRLCIVSMQRLKVEYIDLMVLPSIKVADAP